MFQSAVLAGWLRRRVVVKSSATSTVVPTPVEVKPTGTEAVQLVLADTAAQITTSARAIERNAERQTAALHVIASQSPMTCPLAEYLILKMSSYYHFEKNATAPVKAHIALPQGPGFGIELDGAKVEQQSVLSFGG